MLLRIIRRKKESVGVWGAFKQLIVRRGLAGESQLGFAKFEDCR